MKIRLLTITTLFACNFLIAQPLAIPKKQHNHNHNHLHQHDHGHNHGHNHNYDHDVKNGVIKPSNHISFIKNSNQWDKRVKYKAPLGGMNSLYLEQKGFTYTFANAADVSRIHEISHDKDAVIPVDMHTYKVHFKNALDAQFQEHDKRREYYNYFLGNDPEKWASKVPLFNQVSYQNLYKGIDLKVYQKEGFLKYDFILAPHSDPKAIEMDYEGADAIEIDNSNLLIYTSVQNVTEQKPYAYQIIKGKEIEVPCEYEIKGNVVSFVFPEGYNKNHELIIDPTVVASTLSGMNDNYSFGHCAAFDSEGNIYAGGRAFGSGYITTPGAFQVQYGNGESDIAVTKYNPTGSAQIYATYIGGSQTDAPHSIITDFNGQLYIFGTSNSTNYPVSTNAFQPTNGGIFDIVVTKLNADGSGLVGSTYVGGSFVDGLNQSLVNDNYDDHFRGEIVLDQQGNAYIASCTISNNFPVTSNAFDQSHNSSGIQGQDAVVFKLNNDLSTMFWSTYLGEDDDDAAFGLRVDDFGNTYVTGYAGDSSFPTTTGTVQANWAGGEEEAFVSIINPTGSGLIASTFWGSAGDEHSFFLDIDEDNNIHIYGQTTGSMPITPNTYFTEVDSKLFLSAFSNDLTSVVYSTVFGNGPNNASIEDLIPVAFMVDKCNNIYFSGYQYNNGQINLPTSSDAISTTPGTFYLGVLDPLATGLQFGTFYGDANHVDGGTSRFDKSGTVYQGVCSCNTSGEMNTLPNAFATNQSQFCDIGVFKIDFEIPTVTAAGVAIPTTSGCAPFTVDFQYTGQDATVFEWHFDDNNAMAITEDANHTFTEPGTYEVMLVAANQLTCNSVDTSFLIVDVLESSSTLTESTICNADETVFLDASTTNATYTWQDGSTNSTYSANGEGVYWVDVSLLNGACTRRDSFVLILNNSLNLDLGPDFSVCDESVYTIDASTTGAVSFEWDNGSNDSYLDIFGSGTYSVTVYDSDACAISDEINITFSTTPIIDLGPDTLLCDLYTVTLDPETTGATYLWQDGSTDNTFTVTDPGTYYVDVDVDGCVGSDTVMIDYLAEVFLDIQYNTLDCFEDCDANIDVSISGGNGQLNFLWNTGETNTSLINLCEGDYTLTVTDDLCNYVLTTIEITEPLPLNYEYAVIDVVCPGDGTGVIEIFNLSGGTPPYLFSLNNGPFSSDSTITNLDGGSYNFVLSDANGCTMEETISIYEPPAITVSAGPDHTIELGEGVEIDGLVFPIANQSVVWSPSDSLSCITCLEPWANPTSTMTYTISVTDSITGCVITDQMIVEVIKNRNVFIPNVFTPNGDGANDQFTIYTGNGVRKINEFKVYDRWGALVYGVEDIYPGHNFFGWDGFKKGKEMNNAVFAWYAEIEFLDNEVILYKGDVTLAK